MKIQKVINYKIKQLSETKTDSTDAELLVNVSEDKANSLIHRALVKQQKEKREDTFRVKLLKNTTVFKQQHDTIMWLGHASFFIRINGG